MDIGAYSGDCCLVDATRVLQWEPSALAAALRIEEADVPGYFMDGRRGGFLLERRIEIEESLRRAENQNAGFDLVDSAGRRWEVRSITRRGVYFCPSGMVGSGRAFEAAGFLGKLQATAGFFVADLVRFPQVPCWRLPGSLILDWWTGGLLNSRSGISRAGALSLIARHDPSTFARYYT